MTPVKYVIVGTGHRALSMFGQSLSKDFPNTAKLAGVCDANPLRAEAFNRELPGPVPVFSDFNVLLREVNPDAVVVATRDGFHAEYIIAALKAGKRVVSEKPLCTTAAQCRAILAAAAQNKERCLVTHNARYGMANSAIHEILRSGRLGRPFFMQFDETLDRCHGADYFRRWHRLKANSGGLLVHKSCHHFDCLNWWANSRPVRVTAQGRLNFYGKNGPFRSERCHGCPHSRGCAFYTDLFARDTYRKLYLEAEEEDGYLRDGCVFDPEIDIEDQASVLIRYENDLEVAYTLTAYSPYESQRVVIECEKGRIEYHERADTGWALDGQSLPGIETIAGEQLKLYIAGGGIEEIPLESPAGEHGGADPKLRADFFGSDWVSKPNAFMASLDEAVQAVLVGAAANQAIASGQPVDVQKLLEDR